jgi:hypothetical protein
MNNDPSKMNDEVFYDGDEEEETNIEEVESLGCATMIIIAAGIFLLVSVLFGIHWLIN